MEPKNLTLSQVLVEMSLDRKPPLMICTPDTETFKLSKIDRHSLEITAPFVEIENCKIKLNNLIVNGNLFLHDCSKTIKEVRVTGDILLYNCAKIRNITCKTAYLFKIIYSKSEIYESNFRKLNTNKDINLTNIFMDKEIPLIETLSNFGAKKIKINSNQSIRLQGDCGELKKVKFAKSGDFGIVYLAKDAIFNGKVTYGKVVQLDE